MLRLKTAQGAETLRLLVVELSHQLHIVTDRLETDASADHLLWEVQTTNQNCECKNHKNELWIQGKKKTKKKKRTSANRYCGAQ